MLHKLRKNKKKKKKGRTKRRRKGERRRRRTWQRPSLMHTLLISIAKSLIRQLLQRKELHTSDRFNFTYSVQIEHWFQPEPLEINVSRNGARWFTFAPLSIIGENTFLQCPFHKLPNEITEDSWWPAWERGARQCVDCVINGRTVRNNSSLHLHNRWPNLKTRHPTIITCLFGRISIAFWLQTVRRTGDRALFTV